MWKADLNFMWIFDCVEVSTPNPHIVQGSTVLTRAVLMGYRAHEKIMLCPFVSLDTLLCEGNKTGKNSKTSLVQGTKIMNVQKSSRWNSMAKEKVHLVGRDFGDINRCGAFVELDGSGACRPRRQALCRVDKALVPPSPLTAFVTLSK